MTDTETASETTEANNVHLGKIRVKSHPNPAAGKAAIEDAVKASNVQLVAVSASTVDAIKTGKLIELKNQLEPAESRIPQARLQATRPSGTGSSPSLASSSTATQLAGISQLVVWGVSPERHESIGYKFEKQPSSNQNLQVVTTEDVEIALAGEDPLVWKFLHEHQVGENFHPPTEESEEHEQFVALHNKHQASRPQAGATEERQGGLVVDVERGACSEHQVRKALQLSAEYPSVALHNEQQTHQASQPQPPADEYPQALAPHNVVEIRNEQQAHPAPQPPPPTQAPREPTHRPRERDESHQYGSDHSSTSCRDFSSGTFSNTPTPLSIFDFQDENQSINEIEDQNATFLALSNAEEEESEFEFDNYTYQVPPLPASPPAILVNDDVQWATPRSRLRYN
ncbi:hypothetical protein G7Y89_g9227 [Cudoniella acicularis]|uniref:Uncharacterized protein n=1 Tax=Cudoniella acicularis TaxID=354080 RepID=A0A8H4W2S9_9HELO|nr:hypothetical protein G7Y89_g9227 [Cudoniella acicularis]